jgi:hypothetical protein
MIKMRWQLWNDDDTKNVGDYDQERKDDAVEEIWRGLADDDGDMPAWWTVVVSQVVVVVVVVVCSGRNTDCTMLHVGRGVVWVCEGHGREVTVHKIKKCASVQVCATVHLPSIRYVGTLYHFQGTSVSWRRPSLPPPPSARYLLLARRISIAIPGVVIVSHRC